VDGLRDQQQSSTLCWPTRLRPSPQAWVYWRRFINTFETSSSLTTPLGPWIHTLHQKWQWFHHRPRNTVFHRDGELWRRYTPICSNSITRSHKSHYQTYDHHPPPTSSTLLPATIHWRSPLVFTSMPSPNNFPTTSSSAPPPSPSLSLYEHHQYPQCFKIHRFSINISLAPLPPLLKPVRNSGTRSSNKLSWPVAMTPTILHEA